jgi:hypothetical protein
MAHVAEVLDASIRGLDPSSLGIATRRTPA